MKNKLLLLAISTVLCYHTLMAQVPSYVPTNGLVGYWPFNGNANDQSGNGNNGKVISGLLSNDRLGNANSSYYLNGQTDYITVPSVSSMLPNRLTLSAWVKIPSNYTGNNRIGPIIRSRFFGYVLWFDSSNGSIIHILHHNSSTTTTTNTPSNINDNQWHQIVGTFDGTNNKLYLDGQLISTVVTTTLSNLYYVSDGPVAFGRDGNNPSTATAMYQGWIDDIGIWNRALSSSEIQLLYTGCSTAAPTGSTGQNFCFFATLANLSAIGTNIQWYATSTGGTALASTTALSNGTTYYASQTVNGCESTSRLAVNTNDVFDGNLAPTGLSNSYFCNSATVADLSPATQWYASPYGGNPLPSTTILQTNTSYYFYRGASGANCVMSPNTVIITAATPPAANASQTLCSSSTVANLTATGTNIKWYSTNIGGTALANTIVLVNGAMYYASQTVNGCESTTRLAVNVNLNNPTVSASSTTICAGTNVTLTANSNLTTTQIQAQVNNLVNSGLWNLLVTYNSHYYLQYQTRMTWPQAKILCEQNGGYMYCVNSQLENNNVSVPIANSQVYGDFLLGLYQDINDPSYSEPAGGWKWLDGSTFSYTNWASISSGWIVNEPSGGTENFGIMDWSNTGPYWNDTYDNINGTVVMEYIGNSTYLWSTGATTAAINVTPTTTTQYWVDVTTNSVTCRKFITITVNSTTTAPTANTTQNLCSGATVANLTATGTNIKWYATSTGGTALATTTALVNGKPYYASQTLNGCESTIRLTVIVFLINIITPNFTAIEPICSGATFTALPTTSENGISGTWSPKLDNTKTTTYTFTPTIGQCATSSSMTITVNPNFTPTFNPVDPICANSPLVTLPTTSNNGFSGIWSPPLDNTKTTTYTFTPIPLNLPVSNLIVNGDFEQGNISFNTDYQYVINNGVFGQQKNYGIVSSPKNWFNAFAPCKDHTTGTGNMIVFDGSAVNSGNDKVWEQTVPVIPNQNYTFSYWVQSVVSANPAKIEVTINGTSIGIATAPSTTCNWVKYSYTWNSGNSTNATISMYDRVFISGGNDFAIDDITLSTTSVLQCATPTEMTIFVISNSSAPTGSASQTFCSSSTVANLTATGTNIKWYAASIGGTALSSIIELANGTTYYASQTVNGCESTTRLAVTVSLNNPTVSVTATTVCSGQTTVLSVENSSSNGVRFFNLRGPSEPNQTVSINQWHNIVVTKQNLDGKVFIDGNLVINSQWANNQYNWTSLYLGANYYTGWDSFFKGWIDEVRISNIVRTDNEIIKNYNLNTPYINDINTIGLWHFDESNGTNFINQSNGINGTLQNGPTFQPGKYGNSLYFDGIDDRGDCDFNMPENNFTLELWVKIDGNIISGPSGRVVFIEPYGVYNSEMGFFPENNNSTFLWSTGATTASLSVNPTSTTQYWVDVTTNGVTCRKFITITVNSTSSAPTGSASQTFCSSSTVANLTATGTNIKWYATSTGGTALATTTALVNGATYYASQTVNGCESTTRLAVKVSLNATATITLASGSENIVLFQCYFSPIVYTLGNGATGVNISGSFSDWLTITTVGKEVTISSNNMFFFLPGNYYFEISTTGGCGSASRTITLYVGGGIMSTELKSPKDTANQSVCRNEPIQDVRYAVTYSQRQGPSMPEVIGLPAGVTFSTDYTDFSTNEIIISGTPTQIGNFDYYIQDYYGCGGSNFYGGTITVISTSAPTGANNQKISQGATLANLVVVGTNVQWYEDSSGGSPLPKDSILINGTTYYASQTVNGCESSERLSVIAELTTLTNPEFNLINLNYSPNPVTDILNIKASIKLKDVKICNVLGQILLQQRLNSSDIQLNISNVPTGTYFVIVEADNKKETFKVVKK